MPATDLAAEDELRLAVLLAGDVHAVRIDEGALQLHALTARGEARIALHPTGRPERYLMQLRERLAGHAMGSPGGYPVHLRRWTRSGHASPKSLQALLCLGEPEAVTAVALSAELTDELARRVWWAQPGADIARYMLGHTGVRGGTMGPTLAQYLVEHLPFEEDADAAMQSVTAIAAAGLLDEATRQRLWRAAQNRPHYLIGWLEHASQTLPPAPARELLPAWRDAADPWAGALQRWASAQGQGTLRALALALDKPPTHEAVYRVLDVTGTLFAPAPDAAPPPGLAAEAAALAALARASRRDAEPILARTSAVGPLMRRHLEPVLAPLRAGLRVLLAPAAPR
ncbi:MAG: hypothetical protein ABT20_10705 [Rubrivivax sp. SCN 70-15]|nr:MAG: hypothetical protein ABT20_10705 [Rubrivivax sp. SCN 70-15]